MGWINEDRVCSGLFESRRPRILIFKGILPRLYQFLNISLDGLTIHETMPQFYMFFKHYNHVCMYIRISEVWTVNYRVMLRILQEKCRFYSNPSVLYGQKLIPLVLGKNRWKLIYTIILASFALSLALSCFGYGLDFRADVFIGYFVICYFINVAASFWSNQCHMVRVGAGNIRQFFTQVRTFTLNTLLYLITTVPFLVGCW